MEEHLQQLEKVLAESRTEEERSDMLLKLQQKQDKYKQNIEVRCRERWEAITF